MRTIIARFCLFALISAAVLGAERPVTYPPSELTKTLNDLARRANHAQHYSWTGILNIAVRKGNAPFMPVSQSKVQIAIGENGKSLLKMATQGTEEYWLISDGKKTWSYLPAKKQYMEEESASLEDGDDAEDGPLAETYARAAIQNIADFTKRAQSLTSTKTVTLRFDKGKVNWPVIDILDKPDADGDKAEAEIAMAPDRPILGRFVWAEAHSKNGETIVLRADIEFSSFSLEEPVPDPVFTFNPPRKAKPVDELAIPGQAGSALLNHVAPDFETRTLTGEKVKLSELQGKVVMLDFWASWCPPCRAELPTIAKLYSEFKDKGLIVYGVNDEGRPTARKYLEKADLLLPTLDDSSEKTHRLYRVSAIPTVFIIGADGKVVKWFRGSRGEDTLLAALKSAGIAN